MNEPELRMEIYQPTCPWHIRIGDLFISPGTEPGKVWIGDVRSAEGGNFDTELLAPVLSEFYAKHF